MKSYKDVKEQIARLEKEAEALRQRELKNVIAQVRRTIEQYELTPADLGLAGASKARGGRKATVKTGSRGRASIGVAKYRDPATGKTWTGRGRPPTWMVGVKDPSAYLIDAAPARPAAKPAAKKTRATKKAAPKKVAAKKTRAPKATRKAAKKASAKSNGKTAAQPAEGGETNA